MTIWELTFIAIALSMDAFAVSIACGISTSNLPTKNALIITFTFGLFQAVMPILGWQLSSIGYDAIKDFDHWVAFIILLCVGGKMFWDAFASKNEDENKTNFTNPLNLKMLSILAVATSLDALAVGVSFKFLNRPILLPSLYIGIVTFLICIFGIKFGTKIGNAHDSKFTFAGGLVLILIGVKILIEG